MTDRTDPGSSSSALAERARGFWAYYRRYTTTAIHAAATAALTAFGLLLFIDPAFAWLAIAAYVLPPVILYLTGSDVGADPERESEDGDRPDRPRTPVAGEVDRPAERPERGVRARESRNPAGDGDRDADADGSDADGDSDGVDADHDGPDRDSDGIDTDTDGPDLDRDSDGPDRDSDGIDRDADGTDTDSDSDGRDGDGDGADADRDG